MKTIPIKDRTIHFQCGDDRPTIFAVQFGAYHNNGALAVFARIYFGDGQFESMPISVNLPDDAAMLDDGEFFLKEWSENENIAQALRTAGLVENVGKTASSGFIKTIQAVRLVQGLLDHELSKEFED